MYEILHKKVFRIECLCNYLKYPNVLAQKKKTLKNVKVVQIQQ